MDFDRKQLRIAQGKGKKDRYVPLSQHLIRGMKTYIEAEKPQEWLFNGLPKREGDVVIKGRYSKRAIEIAVKQAVKRAGQSICNTNSNNHRQSPTCLYVH